MITLDDRIRRSGAPLETEADGEVIMMDLASGKYFNLDRIGSEIWHRLATPQAVGSLCDALAARYDAPVETIQRDVLSLLEQMLAARLISVEA